MCTHHGGTHSISSLLQMTDFITQPLQLSHFIIIVTIFVAGRLGVVLFIILSIICSSPVCGY